MSSVVLDASAALAWLLPSQSTRAAFAFLEGADALRFEAPAVFEWEVRNVLLAAERRGTLSSHDYDGALVDYQELDVTLHPPAVEPELLAMLARKLKLSLFDACYLSLAVDRNWPLVSRDDALLKAAAASGVDCFDLRGPAA